MLNAKRIVEAALQAAEMSAERFAEVKAKVTADPELASVARKFRQEYTKREKTGADLFADGLAIIAAGEGDQGGTRE